MGKPFTMSQKVHNFSAGPGILPDEVIQQAAQAVLNFNGTGLSLLEMSHRSKEYVAVMVEARAIVKRLLGLGDDYEVIYVGGGASLQFAMVPFNLLTTGNYAAYTNTGVWAKKAIKEAKMMGKVTVVASSEDKNYNFIPKDYSVPGDADYFHCTSNNTIYGTQMKTFPKSSVPLVCDMSSDIFSRVLDFTQFDLIYAGAQKNMGPAGATMVAVKKSILGKNGRTIPSMLDYNVHIEGESMYNTPPVFPVYCVLLTLQWVEKMGGIAAMEKRNNAKAELLYNEIDRNSLFVGTAAKEDRSYMNVCFVMKDESKEEAFSQALKAANISGLKGHRSVGGFRASIYNAMPIESVQVLVDVMKQFEQTHA